MHRTGELRNRCFTPKEERRIFIAEIEQAPIGTYRGEGVADCLQRVWARRLPMNGIAQRVQQNGIIDAGTEIDPGILIQESQWWLGAWKEEGDDRKVLATALSRHLALQREVLLPLLPRSHLALADTNGHRSTARQSSFQCLRPRLSRREIPPVEKDLELLLAQPLRQRLHLRMVAPVGSSERHRTDGACDHPFKSQRSVRTLRCAFYLFARQRREPRGSP